MPVFTLTELLFACGLTAAIVLVIGVLAFRSWRLAKMTRINELEAKLFATQAARFHENGLAILLAKASMELPGRFEDLPPATRETLLRNWCNRAHQCAQSGEHRAVLRALEEHVRRAAPTLP